MSGGVCSIEGCTKRAKNHRGWCSMHYWRWQHHGDPLRLKREIQLTCTAEGCTTAHFALGYCNKHYNRLKRTGQVDDRRGSHGSVQERFKRFVEPAGPDECWPWQGSKNNRGYGRLGRIYAHRLSFELRYGPILDDDHVLHQCDNPPCVNPSHLRRGTASENIREAYERSRKLAVRGDGNPRTKLTDEQVRQIRTLATEGLTYRQIAARFDTSLNYVGSIVRGEVRRFVVGAES